MSEIPIGVGEIIIHNGAHEGHQCVLITKADVVTPPGTEAKKYDKIWLDDPSVLTCLKIKDPAGSFVLIECLVVAIEAAYGNPFDDPDHALQSSYMRVINDNMELKKDIATETARLDEAIRQFELDGFNFTRDRFDELIAERRSDE